MNILIYYQYIFYINKLIKRHVIPITIFITFILFTPIGLTQTYLVINHNNGTQTSINVSEIRKFTFDNFSSIQDTKKISLLNKPFSIFQNFPNPFNPTTTIKYELSESGFIDITIFNIKGQHIKTLFSSKQTNGTYHLEWNGRNENGTQVPTGIYLYQIKCNNKIITKKMTLIK